jgi:hypothetical protein
MSKLEAMINNLTGAKDEIIEEITKMWENI